ncbi:MAG TPA: hypothetical protein VK027_03660 [Chitinophagaceae bacterium]|nr:hypothetical protein [Chitinophagaceae bacterium]
MEQNNNFNQTENENLAKSDGPSPKMLGILAYLTLIGLIIAFVLNMDRKNPYASFHIRQSLGISLTGFVLGIINVIPIIGWIIGIFITIFIIILWIIGIVGALQEKTSPVPVLGEKYQEWFKGI